MTSLFVAFSAGAADEASHSGAKYGDLFPGVKQTNLVANKPEFGAQILDPDLQNAWGIAIRPAGFGGHFWVSSTNVGKSLLYVGDVGGTPLFQDDLKFVNTLGAATGVVFNPGAQFVITQPHENGAITNAAKFLFANASGTITAWTERALPGGGFDRPVDSAVVVDGTNRHSEFLGVALSPAGDFMYAADFGAEPALRAYNGGFVEVAAFPNPFNPEKKPDGFEAFNVQTIGDSVFAMYGRHVPPDPNVVPPAEGRLAEFDADGKLIAKWRGRGYLNYPWGVALAPKDFGLYGGCLLVGNFGDGTIVAFHPRREVALDYVRDEHGKRVVIDGLWGLQFGNGASLGEANHLYFAAGPNKEVDGLFGKLEPNPTTLPYIGGFPCADKRAHGTYGHLLRPTVALACQTHPARLAGTRSPRQHFERQLMDTFTLVRQVVLFAHVVAFAIALSAVLREDVALIKVRRIDPHRLADTARTLTRALIALWVTGLALVAFDVGLDARALIASPKLAAKLIVVSAVTVNGLALHALAFPILRRPRTQGRSGLFVPVVLGAISTVSWLYASFIGVSRLIAPLMNFTDFIALYGVLLTGAIAVALVFVHPRLTRRSPSAGLVFFDANGRNGRMVAEKQL